MAGLVLGVTVRANPTGAVVSQNEARRIKLFVQEEPGRFGDRPALGYVLQRGEQEPRPMQSRSRARCYCSLAANTQR